VVFIGGPGTGWTHLATAIGVSGIAKTGFARALLFHGRSGQCFEAGSKLDPAHLAGQAHNLGEQCGEFTQVQGSKVTNVAAGGEVVGGEYPKGHVLKQLLGNLAGAEGSRGLGVHQDFDHHGRGKGLLTGAAISVAGMKGAQV
jgi:hypothetical protein